MSLDLQSNIRIIEDFPKPGISFKDISPLLANPPAFKQTIQELARRFAPLNATKIAAAEARGFIFGVALAMEMGLGFVMVRKPGKLPGAVREASYSLEYGKDTLCIHDDALNSSDRVLLIDDLLATGGTAGAMVQLVCNTGAALVGVGFVIELDGLRGREKMALPEGCQVETLLHYDF
eukprot:gnl/Trimastix_PCT/3569.p2 GENE.gnl/Trimastix_PCT/3569~~gnl/Trimastix_PCT/3569.p2  ORF type:complete len:178 (+),score=48.81 gnl/Trimastix_PCT/3569:110-643(+)